MKLNPLLLWLVMGREFSCQEGNLELLEPTLDFHIPGSMWLSANTLVIPASNNRDINDTRLIIGKK